jgi:N-acyl-D-aspartate/D-glutamate deacylase
VTVDIRISGATVIDGSGAPRFDADVDITGDRIVAIGRGGSPARREIAADGLILAPGFIDVHTHYDAQLHWEPTASPSSWHGVTTVLCGNCGFTLAPAKPEDSEWLVRMLSRVEGMSPEALKEGMDWRGGSFGEFWSALAPRLGINAGGYVGHSAIRRYVMGEAASERAASPDEISEMAGLLRQSLLEGALGFSSSQLAMHLAHDGREVPSNFAEANELKALAAVLGEFDGMSLEFIPRTFAEGYSPEDRELIVGMAREAGCSIELNTLARLPSNPQSWRQSMDFAHEAEGEGVRVRPMFAANRFDVFFALGSTFLFDELPAFREVLTAKHDKRTAMLRDPDTRARLKADLANPKAFAPSWDICRLEDMGPSGSAKNVGKTVETIARERGCDPFDCFLDLSLEGNLETTFMMPRRETPEELESKREMILDPLLAAGSSDGGAHLLSHVGADFPTRLLSEWTPDPLSLEQAVFRLTGDQAREHHIQARGFVREGHFADLVLFDPDRLAVGESRFVRDFPAGSSRLVRDAEGYAMTMVNGRITREDGQDTGAAAGAWLRGGGAAA